jgi:hypothetical protein
MDGGVRLSGTCRFKNAPASATVPAMKVLPPLARFSFAARRCAARQPITCDVFELPQFFAAQTAVACALLPTP